MTFSAKDETIPSSGKCMNANATTCYQSKYLSNFVKNFSVGFLFMLNVVPLMGKLKIFDVVEI